MKLTIVGAGIHGLSTAVQAALRGWQVDVYDQGPVPNPQASSVDDHRLIRHAYGARDGYANLVVHAFASWDRLWSLLGTAHYAETGTLAVGHAGSGWIQGSIDSLQRMGIEVARCSVTECRTFFPTLRLNDDDDSLYSPQGGVLFAARIVSALASYAASLGVRIHEHARMEPSLLPTADWTFWCTGAWTPAPLIRPSRQLLGYFRQAPSWAVSASGSRQLPMLIDLDERGGLYIVQGVDGTRWKFGIHRYSLRGNPDDDRTATPAERKELEDAYRARMDDPEEPDLADARACYYAVNDASRLTLGKSGSQLRFSGGSGHSFKFGALTGEVIVAVMAGNIDVESADALLGGELSADTSEAVLRVLPH